MDNLTHSLVGALIGQAGLKRKTGLAMPALIIGANLPDVDAACFFWLDGTEHLGFRRGITHGPPAMVLLPLVLAGLLYGFDRWQAKRGKRPEGRLPVHFGWLFALSFIACLSHPALDWMNTYGIRLLEPFSSRWFYGDTLFIIDIWLWLLMGFATWFSLRREKRGWAWRWPAVAALAASFFYIGANRVLSVSNAELLNETLPVLECADDADSCSHEIIVSPVMLTPWRREVLAHLPSGWSRVPSGAPLEYSKLEPVSNRLCAWPNTDELVKTRPDLRAFLFWSRAPFVTPMENGKGIQFNDARFYDPLARGRFSVEVPGVECEELPVAKDAP